MNKIYAVGESVLDLIFEDSTSVKAIPGGSMLNTSISLGRIGANVELVSELNNDSAGKIIYEFLEKNNVKTNHLKIYAEGKTSLAIAFLDENKNAKYDFYKINPPKRELKMPEQIEINDVVLFGSIYSIINEIRNDILEILKKAKAQNCIVLYDPNFRNPHKNKLPQVISLIEENISFAKIVRASDEDFQNIFDVENAEEAYLKIKHLCDCLIYTQSNKGVFLKTKKIEKKYEVPKTEIVSTIGAGDSFNAGLIYGINSLKKNEIESFTEKEWDFVIANAINFATNVCKSFDNYISKELADSLH